jgi:hypothetical protein
VIGVRDVIDRAPAAGTLIILNGGDFTEANDNSAQTPQSKHPLAVDTDFDDLSDVAVDITCEMIDYALSASERVVYQGLKGQPRPSDGGRAAAGICGCATAMSRVLNY